MPYGFSTALTAGSHPPRVVSGTVNATTRGILHNEINNNTDEEDSNTPNINSNYRLDSTAFSKAASPAGEVYRANPFAGETEALTVFTTSGLTLGIEAQPAGTTPQPGSLMMNFTGELAPDNLIGPDNISPFLAGNALFSFIAATGGSEVLRMHGQFYLKGWDGSTGMFTTNVSLGIKFFLHPTLLGRLEVDTWRAEGASDHDTTTGSGDPITQRKQFLLPRSTKFGTYRLTITNEVTTALPCSLDCSTDAVRGFEGIALESIMFKMVSLNADGVDFSLPLTYIIGTDDDTAPYGLNAALTAGSHPQGVISGTVIATTHGILRKEINNNTDEAGGNTSSISSNGRSNG